MALVGPTLVLYAVVGIGVAIAVYLSEKRGASAEILFRIAMALPFWPLYIPVLLAHAPASARAHFGHGHGHGLGQGEINDMSAAISQVDAELEAALNSLDGWAEDVLAREKDRIRELRAAWIAQADRIREIDHLLAPLPSTLVSPLPVPLSLPLPVTGTSISLNTGADRKVIEPIHERLARSELACRRNIERLRNVRQRAYDDLMGSLAWVRELVSMIHLAKFTGAPASRAEELVAQIAAAVEGLADVTWREEPTVSADGNTLVPE
jgi:hypothetical protein